MTYVMHMISEQLTQHEEYTIVHYDAWGNSFYMEIVENLDSLLTTELIKEEPDYMKYDRTISAMKLKPVEMNVLDCFMSNMSYSETARFLNVNFTTVWRRRNRIRYKYLQNNSL